MLTSPSAFAEMAKALPETSLTSAPTGEETLTIKPPAAASAASAATATFLPLVVHFVATCSPSTPGPSCPLT
jgi:hypothetical protein